MVHLEISAISFVLCKSNNSVFLLVLQMVQSMYGVAIPYLNLKKCILQQLMRSASMKKSLLLDQTIKQSKYANRKPYKIYPQ